jgi:hypothetical protein
MWITATLTLTEAATAPTTTASSQASAANLQQRRLAEAVAATT